ncbi:Receptor-type tyrosine-protein phosphatase N2, partial [Cichlidogyrus casuarinus]
EQSRVKLRGPDADYINASLIYDHEPRNPAYIATQTPMESTMKDFWQMVWDQASVTIVAMDKLECLVKPDSDKIVDDPTVAVQYWPEEGWERYGDFEVHLVSEHMFCGKEYVVRSFYLKNLQSNETRTVTQFHFLAWSTESPSSVSTTMLEFRRRVNKSFRGKCSPIIIHCPDGSGATGTYLLLDMVLNRIQRGIKELDIAATLEHIRDQRQGTVQTKKQFEFVLAAIAEEVNALLKATNGNS